MCEVLVILLILSLFSATASAELTQYEVSNQTVQFLTYTFLGFWTNKVPVRVMFMLNENFIDGPIRNRHKTKM